MRPLSVRTMVDAYGEILDDVSQVMKKLMDIEMEDSARKPVPPVADAARAGIERIPHRGPGGSMSVSMPSPAGQKRVALGMDFSALYVEDRDLFVIGYDLENGEPGDSYYDLFASEATARVLYRHRQGGCAQETLVQAGAASHTDRPEPDTALLERDHV